MLGGVSATLLGILGDPRQPEMARLRALARIVGALDGAAATASERPAVAAAPASVGAPGRARARGRRLLTAG